MLLPGTEPLQGGMVGDLGRAFPLSGWVASIFRRQSWEPGRCGTLGLLLGWAMACCPLSLPATWLPPAQQLP